MSNTQLPYNHVHVQDPGVQAHRALDIPLLTGAPSPNDIGELYDLLGRQTVLIPIKRGSKMPMRKKWQETTLEETHSPEYVRDLELNNVAVLPGSPSADIIDIDCDDDAFMNAFLAANPSLCADTLQTMGERGRHFWFHIKGAYPKKVEVIVDANGEHVGEFRGGRGSSIIAGMHPSGCEYRILNKVAPRVIEFGQINWPDGYSYPWDISEDEEIARRVGPAFDVNKGKANRINTAFFAEWVKVRRHLVFEETEAVFYVYNDDTGLWCKVTDSRMAEVASEACLEWVNQQDPALVDSLKMLFTQRFRMDLVAMLKSKAASNNFFTTGPLYDFREMYFHCLGGMMRCLPQAGPGAATFLTLPYKERYRSRFRFPCRYVDNPQCPRFDALIESAFGEEHVPFVLKLLGYMLIDGNPGQHIVIVKGPGRSGKSQLALVLKGISPERSWGELRTSQLNGRFELAGFADKRLVYGPDVRKDFFSVDGAQNLKALTGGDPKDAEMKFANERIHMIGDKHVLVTTNDVLRLAPGEDAGAWQRRLIVLETRPADLNKIVVNLATRILEEEKDAVFTKLMNAGYQASVELASKGMLDVPEQFRMGASNAIILTGDVGLWISECISEGGKSFATRELYMLHSNWCAARGETPVTQSSFEKTLRRSMEDHGHQLSHSILLNGSHCNGYRRLEVAP